MTRKFGANDRSGKSTALLNPAGRSAVLRVMVKSPEARQEPSEDLYADAEGEGVPSYRRSTVPVARAKVVVRAVVQSVHEADTRRPERLVDATGVGIPEESMRRLKAARRVSGVPEFIREEMSEAALRDKRRE